MKYEELPRNIVRCPYCKQKIGTQPSSVLSIFDPRFKHKGCKDERGQGTTAVYLSIETATGVGTHYRTAKKSEIEVTSIKKRKGRSDKGQKRGAYKPRKGEK